MATCIDNLSGKNCNLIDALGDGLISPHEYYQIMREKSRFPSQPSRFFNRLTIDYLEMIDDFKRIKANLINYLKNNF